MTPKDEILSLIQTGNTLHKQAEQALSTGIHSNGMSFLGDLITKEVVPHGYRRIARNAGKTLQRTSKKAIENLWREMGQRFLSECESKIKQMSVNTKNLNRMGNSPRLGQKFNRVRRMRNPVPFFTTTVAILEELENLDLIWNDNIANELMHRKEIAEAEKREKANLRHMSPRITKDASLVDLFDRLAISEQVKRYPSVKNSVMGAFDRLDANDPDSLRHCIISCRAAIESFCIETGHDADWKNALNNVLSSDTDRRQVKGVWNYLSSKGAHGGHHPTKEEAEYCLQLTIETLIFIVSKM